MDDATDYCRVHFLLLCLGVDFSGRTEGDGITTLTMQGADVSFDKEGNLISVKEAY